MMQVYVVCFSTGAPVFDYFVCIKFLMDYDSKWFNNNSKVALG